MTRQERDIQRIRAYIKAREADKRARSFKRFLFLTRWNSQRKDKWTDVPTYKEVMARSVPGAPPLTDTEHRALALYAHGYVPEMVYPDGVRWVKAATE